MHRVLTLTVAAALSLVACSDSEPADDESAATTTTTIVDTTAATTTSTARTTTTANTTTVAPSASTTSAASAPADQTTTTAPPSSDAISRDDLVRFVAATESVLEGTSNEGVVRDAPEIYIAIGQAACARFTAGDTFEQVSNDLLTELASTNPGDDELLVGAILGATTQTICPEHADLI